jgi:hypothetical protein
VPAKFRLAEDPDRRRQVLPAMLCDAGNETVFVASM